MFGRVQTVRLRAIRSAQGVGGAALPALLLALFMILSSEATHACPGMAAGAVTVAHKAKSAAVVTATVSIPKVEAASGGGTCCAGAFHSNGVGCSNGCCASCSAALIGSASIVVFQEVAADHALRRERHLAWAIPDRNFRPPRSMA